MWQNRAFGQEPAETQTNVQSTPGSANNMCRCTKLHTNEKYTMENDKKRRQKVHKIYPQKKLLPVKNNRIVRTFRIGKEFKELEVIQKVESADFFRSTQHCRLFLSPVSQKLS